MAKRTELTTLPGYIINPVNELAEHVIFAGLVAGGNAQLVFAFENGFGASVLRGPTAGCGEYYELAVVRVEGPHTWRLTYDTGLCGDVAYLDDEEVVPFLARIKALPARALPGA